MADKIKISKINWGHEAAENDENLLDYFVVQEDFERVVQLQKNIVIGRKGAGKSALFKKIYSDLSNPNIYKKNIVCSIRPTFNILSDTRKGKQNQTAFQYAWIVYIYTKLLNLIGDLKGGLFETAVIKEAREFSIKNRIAIPNILEAFFSLMKSAKIKQSFGTGEIELAIERASKKEYHIDALESHLSKIGAEDYRFVILIDDLDQGWDNTDFTNNFLLGLFSAIDYIKSSVNNFKSILFIRDDIYSILMQKTSNSDKYRNFYYIKWEQDQILKILIERIKHAYRDQNIQYPSSNEKLLTDVFPAQIGTKLLSNWLYEKTFGRPRDIIQLARLYTEKNVQNKPDQNVFLKTVSSDYSQWKLDDLATEYLYQFSHLDIFLSSLKEHFKGYSYSMDKQTFDSIIEVVFDDLKHNDIEWINNILSSKDKYAKTRNFLYDLYIIGDRISSSEVIYKNNYRHKPIFKNIDIHPAFREAFSVSKRRVKKN